MDSAEILSAVAVAVSAGTLIVTHRLGVRRFDHERKLDDRADARSILAEGALELGRMKIVMKDVFTAFQNPLNSGSDWPVDFRDRIGELEAATDALESAVAGVRIRFRQGDEVVSKLDRALKSVRSLISVYVIARGDEFGGGSPGDPANDYGEAFELSEAFDEHRDAYLAAAQKVVGVALAND